MPSAGSITYSDDYERDLEALLAQRELARRNYRDFLQYYLEVTRSDIRWSWYLDYLCDVMQAVSMGHFKRLIVNIPPRHAKSTVISQMYQAWRIGCENHDHSSVLSCAATATLAARDSRRTLWTLKSDWFAALFPGVGFIRENEVDWETDGGARRMAVGVGGTVMGRGANTIIWDDILKTSDGMSEIVRGDTNEWLGEVLASRLDDPKNGVVVGIMQRIHEIDPTGYLLEMSKRPGARTYEHICIPLEAPKRTIVELNGHIYKIRRPDELIDEQRMGKIEVDALKAEMRSNFEGQYNQNPIKMVGGHLNTVNLVESEDDGLTLLNKLGLIPNAYLDFAATEEALEKDDPDENTITIAARDQFNRLVILDVWGKVCSYEELANTLLAMKRTWNFQTARCEKGGLYNLFQPMLRSRMAATGTFTSYEPLPSTNKLGDKVTRSMAFQGMVNAAAVLIPNRKKAPWLEKFEKQMRAFPRGAHDDRLEGAFYAAIDFNDLRKGDSKNAKATDAAVESAEQLEMKQRIQTARDALLNPPVDNDGW